MIDETPSISRPNHPVDAPPFILPSPLPNPPKRVKPTPPPPETPSRNSAKRPLPEEDENGVIDLEPTPKKTKPTANATSKKRKAEETQSPSKRRRLEEDGLVLMDGLEDRLEDEDCIIIDD